MNAWLRSLSYIMQIVNIHKQAELPKTMYSTVDQRICNHSFLHKCERVQSSILCMSGRATASVAQSVERDTNRNINWRLVYWAYISLLRRRQTSCGLLFLPTNICSTEYEIPFLKNDQSQPTSHILESWALRSTRECKHKHGGYWSMREVWNKST